MNGLLIAIIVLAVILGLVGLLVEALQWLLIIAALLIIAGLIRLFITRKASKEPSTDV